MASSSGTMPPATPTAPITSPLRLMGLCPPPKTTNGWFRWDMHGRLSSTNAGAAATSDNRGRGGSMVEIGNPLTEAHTIHIPSIQMLLGW